MKNQDIFELFFKLKEITGLKGVKFNYAIAKNLNILLPEVQSLEKASEMSEDYKKFETERVEICKKYAKKDDKGEPILNKNQYVIEDTKKFDKELEALQETHKKTIDLRAEQMKDFTELLLKENPITLHKIQLEDIPEEILTEQLNSIYKLIENDSETSKNPTKK